MQVVRLGCWEETGQWRQNLEVQVRNLAFSSRESGATEGVWRKPREPVLPSRDAMEMARPLEAGGVCILRGAGEGQRWEVVMNHDTGETSLWPLSFLIHSGCHGLEADRGRPQVSPASWLLTLPQGVSPTPPLPP